MTIPGMVFRDADLTWINVYECTLDIITHIHRPLPDAALQGRTTRPINLCISRRGEVSFD